MNCTHAWETLDDGSRICFECDLKTYVVKVPRRHMHVRIHNIYLPTLVPVLCPMLDCAYCESGVCPDVRTNKGNGDAKCRKWGVRKLFEMLESQ